MRTHATYMDAVGAASTAHEEMRHADRSVALARCRMPLSAVHLVRVGVTAVSADGPGGRRPSTGGCQSLISVP